MLLTFTTSVCFSYTCTLSFFFLLFSFAFRSSAPSVTLFCASPPYRRCPLVSCTSCRCGRLFYFTWNFIYWFFLLSPLLCGTFYKDGAQFLIESRDTLAGMKLQKGKGMDRRYSFSFFTPSGILKIFAIFLFYFIIFFFSQNWLSLNIV